MFDVAEQSNERTKEKNCCIGRMNARHGIPRRSRLNDLVCCALIDSLLRDDNKRLLCNHTKNKKTEHKERENERERAKKRMYGAASGAAAAAALLMASYTAATAVLRVQCGSVCLFGAMNKLLKRTPTNTHTHTHKAAAA